MTQDPEHHVHLAAVKVDGPAQSVLVGLEVDGLVTDDDSGLVAVPSRVHQLCHVHFVRLVGELLREEGVGLLDRETPTGEVRGILARLRHSVEFHATRREWRAIAERVRGTLNELEGVARRLERGACPHSARTIRREAKALVVFAEVAVHGISTCPRRRTEWSGLWG